MIGIPFTILGLAAGVYLLIQVKQLGLSAMYRNLAWLVVLLSLLFMACCTVRGVMHHRHMSHCSMGGGHCDMKGSGSCPYMKDGHGPMGEGGCCKMGGDKGHCAMSEGSSCSDMPCCAKSHCAPGSTEGCCAKDSSAKKCEAGKMPCCHKGGPAADSSAHK